MYEARFDSRDTQFLRDILRTRPALEFSHDQDPQATLAKLKSRSAALSCAVPWCAILSVGSTGRHRAMKRREFIGLLGGVAVASWTSPFPALVQTLNKPPRRIGVLGGSSPAASAKLTAAFEEGMRTHGYIEGRDYEREYGWAEGRLERLSGLAEQMVR